MHSATQYTNDVTCVCFVVAKPPDLHVKSSTKNDISLVIDPPDCSGDTGYVYGYAVYYYPASQHGKC